MNKPERNLPPMGNEAVVEYRDAEFRVVKPGHFVRCATTGAMIALDDLKYWSVDLQEAYAGPQAVLKRLQQPKTSG